MRDQEEDESREVKDIYGGQKSGLHGFLNCWLSKKIVVDGVPGIEGEILY
jgi:hypothetical protein